MADLSLVFDLLARDRASSEITKVGKSMDEAGDHAGGFGEKLSGVWDVAKGAALGAGLAVGAAFFGAIDQQSANTKLSAQMGLTPEGSAAAGKLAGSLYAQNYGDSLGDVNDAIRAVSQNMLIDINDADMSTITGKVLDLSSAFGVDAADSTKALGNLIETGLAPDASAALDIVTAGFQMGNDAAGDWLDTLNEYSVQFQKMGISGQEASGLITQGMQAGARDSDLVADAIKEFSIRAVDGSQSTADAFTGIGLNAKRMTAAIAAGGPQANAALATTLQSLRDVKDPAKQAQMATALFGTQAEDLGKSLYALDPAAAAAMGGTDAIKGSADRLDATLATGVGPTLETLKRNISQTAVDAMGSLIAGFTTGRTEAGGWQGTVQNLAASVGGVLSPVLSGAGDVLTGTVGPALHGVFDFLAAHQQTVLIVAGVIAAVLTPALVAWGTASVINAAKSAVAWVTSTLAASGAAVGQAISVGVIVGGWVLMGVQSLLQAGRMAAAWVIAMGPVGWIIGIVIGLVALIVANWDKVKQWTGAAWDWVSQKVSGAWDWITGKIGAALSFVWNLFLNWTLPGLIIKHWDTIKSVFTDGIGNVVNFMKGLPGKVIGAIGDFGSLLYNKGKDLINGLISGAGSLLKNIGKFFLDLVPGFIRKPFESALGIGSDSKVFIGYGQNIGGGLITGLAGMRPAVADELARLADAQGFGSLSAATGGGLGYTPPGYDDMPPGGGAGGGASYYTTVSGVASPEQVAAQVAAAQRTNEFLAGGAR